MLVSLSIDRLDAVARPMSFHGSCEYLGRKEGRKEMFYLTTISTHFIYGYMASDIWYTTIQIDR